MGRTIFPPDSIDLAPDEYSIFLAGSIDLGKAIDWQQQVTEHLSDTDAVFLNPRRPQWDSTWEQTITNSLFREQVEWELQGMERANTIAFYFAPQSQAPITLLELGLAARGKKAIVCCAEDYWRKGNVDVVCQFYGVQQVATLDELINTLRLRISV